MLAKKKITQPKADASPTPSASIAVQQADRPSEIAQLSPQQGAPPVGLMDGPAGNFNSLPVDILPASGSFGAFKSTRSIKPQQVVKQDVVNAHSGPEAGTELPKLNDLNELSQLKPYLEAYINILKGRNEMSLVGLLDGRPLRLEQGHTLVVPVNGPVNETILLKGKEDLVKRLRSWTGINTISLTAELVLEEVDSSRPYTMQDKYQVLAAKHPDLELLRQKFQMDFDY